tara:strand:+ start:229 stop:1116 length:888 start_codon:yes stop_codon:yes gene_type:complete
MNDDYKKSILDYETNDGIEISSLIAVLKNHFRLFGATVISVTFISIIYSLLLSPVYQAEVIAIPAEKTSSIGSLTSSFSGIASIAGIDLPSGPADDIQTSIAIAESKKFNILFVNQENLLPILFKEDWDEDEESWIENEPPSDLSAQARMRTHYSIGYDKRDGIVIFTMNWDDPNLAAKYANQFVSAINNYIRNDEILEAEKSIDYLKKEIKKTTLVDIKNVLNSLIQEQLQTIMLANVREDYAFKIIDPAMVPKSKIKPQRRQIVILGFILGLIIGAFVIAIRENQKTIISIFK